MHRPRLRWHERRDNRTIESVQYLHGVPFVRDLAFTPSTSCSLFNNSGIAIAECSHLSFQQGVCTGDITFAWLNGKQAFEVIQPRDFPKAASVYDVAAFIQRKLAASILGPTMRSIWARAGFHGEERLGVYARTGLSGNSSLERVGPLSSTRRPFPFPGS